MKPKTKAFIYNLLGFVGIFLILRFGLMFLFPSISHLILVLIAAFASSILAPKFAVVEQGGKEQLKMKWIFIKGFKDIN
ncbi:hypothetical protein HX109_08370 [Galbibacter sp. BG1]|uniref:hypothetical protein n=1 Tax=Galbibacter sp. BG1 TaxID=1170699 RepID=UPI0015BA8B77|nr:hypothetical protein [Galbibacter sp. BG1]QLE01577.1 hypothetical protein HX109_08370 [Galbibacter sp. BG1]